MSAYDAELHWSVGTLVESRLTIAGLAEAKTTSVICFFASGSSPGGGGTSPLRPGLLCQSDECEGSTHSPSLSPEGFCEGGRAGRSSSINFLTASSLCAILLWPFLVPLHLASPFADEDELG